MEVASLLGRYLPSFERSLRLASKGLSTDLERLVNYHLGWEDERGRPFSGDGGKRLRPVLVLLSCEAAGGSVEAATPAAVAVELLHNFSLIHDDIQDRSPERRHRSTVWKVWGQAQAINAGDALHVLAQRSLLSLRDTGVNADRVLLAFDRFAQASLRLCDGQFLDLDFEHRVEVSPDEYLSMIAGKTAALLGCCFELGAIVATANPSVHADFRAIGESLGLAFQIWDDYLGAWGDASVTGKPVHEDIVSRKKTFPVALAFQRVGGRDRDSLRQFYGDSEGSSEVSQVLDLFERLNLPSETKLAADGYVDRALDLLMSIQGNETRKSELALLARYLVGRDR